ncbi:hypothetical protein [Streptomyces sp. NPDC091371]|uniref:hypothetical protein n=1 Tax=Streptomyces sp. NPDC091371 TaxID=3155303 RepID=UPI00344309E5
MDVMAIAENLAADVVWSLLALLVGYLLLRRQNRGLARLLGAVRNRRLIIVLPDMRIREGGTVGTYRRVGFTGNAVSRGEFEAAVALRDALTDPLVRLLQPRRSLMPAGRIGSAGAVEATETCPPSTAFTVAEASADPFTHLPGELSGRSLVLIGGPAYNHLTSLGFLHPDVQAVPEQVNPTGEWGLRIRSGPMAGQFFGGRGTVPDTEIATVQSFTAGTDGPRVTICAGSSDIATLASVDFLLANWRRIARRCGQRPYAFLLRVDLHSGSAQLQAGLVDGNPFTL